MLSLYTKYKEEGEFFIPIFVEFLSRCCSLSTLQLGKEIMDIDMADPEFWKLGINEIHKMLEGVKRFYNE